MVNKQIGINLIVPLYKSSKNLINLRNKIINISQSILINEIILVDDFCPENSGKNALKIFKKINLKTKIIFLANNYGSFSAIREAFKFIEEGDVIVFSADSQESTDTIIATAAKLKQNDYDLVVGQRVERQDKISNILISQFFWKLFNFLVDNNFPKKGVDFFALKYILMKKYILNSNPNSILIYDLFILSKKHSFIPYIRLKSLNKKSGWTIKKKIWYATKLVLNYSYKLRKLMYLTYVFILIIIFYYKNFYFLNSIFLIMLILLNIFLLLNLLYSKILLDLAHIEIPIIKEVRNLK